VLIFLSDFASSQSNDSLKGEKIIDKFVLDSHNNLLFQNGMNVFIDKPLNDTDALEKGFKLMLPDAEQNGGWNIITSKDVEIEEQYYRAILYDYNTTKYIALYCKEDDSKYYFRIFNSSLCQSGK